VGHDTPVLRVSYDVSAEIAAIVSPSSGRILPVAKKRPAPRSRRPRTATSAEGTTPEVPEVSEAAADVEQARETLQQAEANYRRVCDEAAARVCQASRMTLGEAVDGSLEFVRRHPVSGLCAAGVLGFLIGRVLRR
jgi:ElaB/YqjD/DUF883 family membrane-anchored ribosome-binding protein